MIMDITMIVIVFGTGIAAGMYITTQISEWIDRRTNQNKTLMKNIEDWDRKQMINSGREWDHMDKKDTK